MGTTRNRAIETAPGTKLSTRRRRGMAYVYFLSTMMLVAVIGLSALMYARIQRRATQGSGDASAARLNAQAALELGYVEIYGDPAWRTNSGSGAWFSDIAYGGGTISLDVTILGDADSFPDNNPVLLIGTGVHGIATHKIEVTLTALSDDGGLVISPGTGMRNTS